MIVSMLIAFLHLKLMLLMKFFSDYSILSDLIVYKTESLVIKIADTSDMVLS